MKRASRLDLAAQGLGSNVQDSRRSIVRSLPYGDRRSPDPWLGKLVDGRYQVEEVLGRGGMGVVYKVKHKRMGKIAAMKVLHDDLANDLEVVRRFEQEAEAVSRLGHPNTVQVFDFGADKGSLYLVMEFVRGQDLGAIVDRDGHIPFKTLAPLLGQICGSLEEAHALGVVHRDLKPENILVSRTHSGKDFIKVLDFGLAKLSEREDAASETSPGSIVGTPYYMSPEQIRADDVDHRADIYSFGALMFRLLTGENAFNAKTPVGVLTKHLTETLVPPSKQYPGLGIPPKVDDIIVRCMRKKPDDRYDSVRDLLLDIEALYLEGASAASSSDSRHPPSEWLASPQGDAAPVAALLEDEIDHGIDAQLRLRREDLDDFESKIKRAKWIRLIAVPAFLLAAGAAIAYWFLLRPPVPHIAEIEPNNDFSAATYVYAGSEIEGFIGKRISPSEPDKDFFRFDVEASEKNSEVVSIALTCPPNINISLDLYDQNGALLKHSDEAGIGKAETLRRWQVKGPVVVAISGVSAPGQYPVENVSDPYQLRVIFSPSDKRLESEPNDSRADSNLFVLGTPISGHLDHREDQDVYQVSSAEQPYTLLISGTEPLPIQWRVEREEEWHSELSAQVTLKKGETITLRAEPGTDIKNIPYTLDLSPLP